VAGLATDSSIVAPDKMLEGAGINVLWDEVTKVDAVQKSVFVSGGEEFKYDKLFLATGSSSFIPPIEGKDLEGVMTLRGCRMLKKSNTI
jgi:NADH oxidase (H2O2-forming)